MSLTCKWTKLSEARKTYIHFVSIPDAFQFPYPDPVKAAHIQETFRRISGNPDFYISFQIAEQRLDHPVFLPSVNSSCTILPVIFISSFV